MLGCVGFNVGFGAAYISGLGDASGYDLVEVDCSELHGIGFRELWLRMAFVGL